MKKIIASCAFALAAVLAVVWAATSPASATTPKGAIVVHGDDPGITCNIFQFGIATSTEKFQEVVTPSGNQKITCQFPNTGVHPKKALHSEGFLCSIYTDEAGYTYTNDSRATLTPSGNATLTCLFKP